MRLSRRRALLALAATFLVTNAGVQLTRAASASDSVSFQYFARMNQERADHDRAALAWRSDLAGVAQSWAQHMASAQELAHNPNLTTQVHNWRVVGENVGEGPTLDDLDRAFMNSAEHRDNILDPDYTEVGVGSVQDGNGIIWITIDFREPYVRQPAPAPAHTTAPVDHWVRGAAVAPVVQKKPVVVRPSLMNLLRFHAVWPFAPGCMLRFGWF